MIDEIQLVGPVNVANLTSRTRKGVLASVDAVSLSRCQVLHQMVGITRTLLCVMTATHSHLAGVDLDCTK